MEIARHPRDQFMSLADRPSLTTRCEVIGGLSGTVAALMFAGCLPGRGLVANAQETASPTADELAPNLFALTGEGVVVSYTPAGLSGRPQLTYAKGDETLSFLGDEVRSLASELGTLVTVSLAALDGEGTANLTVILPEIELGETTEQTFATVGIVSWIAGPEVRIGARQTYDVVELMGTARSVLF